MPRDLDWGWPSSTELIPQLAAESDGTCLLSFSAGKDSVAAWLALRPHFRRIVPVYGYLVPGLEFIERSLAYYEREFGCRIIRVPHPTFYGWLDGALFQPVERLAALDRADLPVFTWDDVFRAVKEDLGLPPATLAMLGVTAADSLNRHAAMKRYGPVTRKRAVAYPIYDWTRAEIIERIRNERVKLPIDYQWFGRSFDGLDARFLAAIREHAPADYRRICEWFPYAPLVLARHSLYGGSNG